MKKTTIGMVIASISFIAAMAGHRITGESSALAIIAIFTGIAGMGVYFVGFYEVLAERRDKAKNGSENGKLNE